MNATQTLEQTLQAYIRLIDDTRSSNTARTYRNALRSFQQTLTDHNLPPASTPPTELPEEGITWFAADLKDLSATTERLYLTTAMDFYRYLSAEGIGTPNLSRLQLLLRKHSRKPGVRLPQFPEDKIEQVILYAISLINDGSAGDSVEHLRALRDRAFLLTLADTGLRVHEACGLQRGDIDWNEGRALVIGKGDRQAVVRFSSRSLQSLRDYLAARSKLDGSSGRPLPSLALFARHDKGAGKKIKPITTATGRNIVAERVAEVLGEEAKGLITPHSFRHYFVTTVLKASGNLKLAQELARHRSITVTQRYAHLNDDALDRGYYEIFEDHK